MLADFNTLQYPIKKTSMNEFGVNSLSVGTLPVVMFGYN